MGFHNGVPITVVSTISNMPMPTGSESSSRRRAEEDERIEAIASSVPAPIVKPRR
jgi:hypothetical protein